MPLTPDQEPGAAKQYLDHLSANADARDRFAQITPGDHEAIAAEVSKAIGMDVHPSNLPGMAQHLNDNHAELVDQVASALPTMGPVLLAQA
ncbi:MAG: hypothetical protein ACXWNK_06635 [Vulcanimicrobiaceae bacterium]